jgi:hypothetical protein
MSIILATFPQKLVFGTSSHHSDEGGFLSNLQGSIILVDQSRFFPRTPISRSKKHLPRFEKLDPSLIKGCKDHSILFLHYN